MSRIQNIDNTIFALDIQGAYQGGAAASNPSRPIPGDDLELLEYAPWGSSGCLPTQWRDKLEGSTIAARAFYKSSQIIYGKGVAYYKDVIDNGEIVGRRYLSLPDVDDFFKRNKIGKFILRRLHQIYLGNLFCEFILSKDRSRILSVRHLDAEFCRLEKINDDGIIKRIGYTPRWREGYDIPAASDIIDLDLLDEYEYDQQMMEGSRYKYALWSTMLTSGRLYYSMPPWGGLFKYNGWMDVSNRVPQLISVLQQNQTKLKYIIRINEAVWLRWYPKWDTLTAEVRSQKVQEKKRELGELLRGKDGDLLTIRSFISVSFRNPITGAPEPGITVESVDDKIKAGDWIPDSQASDQQIVQTIGLDPSDAGLQPSGGKMGAGSGSDKRVSRINTIGINTSLEEVVLEPLNIIRDYNGWDPGIKFTFRHVIPTTLDRNRLGITDKTHEV